MLLWAHEQLVQVEGRPSVPSQHHRPAGAAAKSSSAAQQGSKPRAALVAADTNIGQHARHCMCAHGCAAQSPDAVKSSIRCVHCILARLLLGVVLQAWDDFRACVAGLAKDFASQAEAQGSKEVSGEEDWHIRAIYGQEAENMGVAANGPQVQPCTARALISKDVCLCARTLYIHLMQKLMVVGKIDDVGPRREWYSAV